MIIETDLGTVTIKPEVFNEIVYRAALESYGTVDIGKGGLLNKLASVLQKPQEKGVEVIEEDNKVTVNLYIYMEYGLPLKRVAANAQENVYHRIKEALGDVDVTVNVKVVGIKI
ncbi:hypothetical protein XO10_06815 [Marinitoga sp. 1135]|uniref:Asp23/Gls24 family envelope stress response protein n=1 Tax=Marinitoga piezophila (strain DSM 14283 / JCM 11233 / KA3) TaxID=443254 RepID=H2J3G5_MARPK|nr:MULTISPECIES: Asp23/Gls24 family envelope stress response protein [Marinitoga]AEX85781.1 hypothetical protein Marpi_1381 [Marinitoga piezophila KA3]APT76223.1 hypothetical protein LN42_07380 [Marinitoga sp. 1137]NUU95982.1 hypothetical protein [Marinitoga sp. 1135]NUU97894.1 hypothetical protein [Marinitoga sp. 1138]